jgi:hypothetical protein
MVGPGLSYLSIGIRRISDLQPVYLLGMDGLDRVGLVAKFGYGYKPLYVLLHQLMDHGYVLLDYVIVHPITHLLLDIIHPYTLYSPDNDCSHTSNYRG